jgi:CheY-like chemotaxis protein
MDNVHRLAWELRPSVLDDLGLELALRRFITQWSETAGIPVDCRISGLEAARLPFEVETTLYRVVQEALTNAARHASAKRVSVLLELRPEHISLIVEDDGRGFDPETVIGQPDPSGKLGLLGMRERVTLLGGMLEIESKLGIGTTLLCASRVRTGLLCQRPPAMKKLRILLADDHEIVREGLRLLIDAQPDMQVVGEAAHGKQVLALVADLNPDLVVMDLSMPELNGLRTTELLRAKHPKVKVVALTAYEDEAYLRQLVKVGACGTS